MPVNCAEIVGDIDRALARVKDDAGPNIPVPCLSSDLAKLITSVRVQAQATPADAALNELHRASKHAQQDLFNLFTILHRIEWMRSCVARDHLNQSMFEQFVVADMDMFHVEFRSIFDYLALAMVPFAKQEIPESFNKLRGRISDRPGYREAIGEQIADIVSACSWFGFVKDSRDHLVHGGDMTVVFSDPDRLLFQTFGDSTIRVDFPPVMFNDHVADFRIYAGMWIARLYDYLERWANTMAGIAGINMIGDPVLCSPGVPIGIDWMRLAREKFVEYENQQ